MHIIYCSLQFLRITECLFCFLVPVDPPKLVLVNALYFTADWEYPFRRTLSLPFYITKNKAVKVDIMHLTEYLKYKHDDAMGAQILELPYKVNRCENRVDECSCIHEV